MYRKSKIAKKTELLNGDYIFVIKMCQVSLASSERGQ